MVNKYQPHVMVLPEDDANRQLANGFLLDPELALRGRRMQVLEPVGGWGQVIERFTTDHVASMDRYAERLMVLLIDFDGQDNRLDHVKSLIPDHLKDRVFIIGAWTEPEDLKAQLGSYEEIGKALAQDCRDNTDRTWGCDMLQHNADELERLRRYVHPILFGPS
jgi:hypothetical protein